MICRMMFVGATAGRHNRGSHGVVLGEQPAGQHRYEIQKCRRGHHDGKWLHQFPKRLYNAHATSLFETTDGYNDNVIRDEEVHVLL